MSRNEPTPSSFQPGLVAGISAGVSTFGGVATGCAPKVLTPGSTAPATRRCAGRFSPVHCRYKKSASPTPCPLDMCSATARFIMKSYMPDPALCFIRPDLGTDLRI